MSLNAEDLVKVGYCEFSGGRMHHDCDIYYAKSFKDKHGKKYQIVFYMYDWSKYPHFVGRNPISFMPEIYYRIDEDVSVYHKFAGFNESIEYVEHYAEKMWEALDETKGYVITACFVPREWAGKTVDVCMSLEKP
jgi:hypothetical protein